MNWERWHNENDSKETHIPHFTFKLQIKCLGESKIRIIDTSICDKEGHRDNWRKSVYASDDDECDSNYSYNYHGIYWYFVGPSLQNEQKNVKSDLLLEQCMSVS